MILVIKTHKISKGDVSWDGVKNARATAGYTLFHTTPAAVEPVRTVEAPEVMKNRTAPAVARK